MNRSWSIVSLSAALWAADSFGAFTILETNQVAAEFEQRTWLREHGLSDDGVQAILQSREGYLWIGTPRGLVRFDGLNFSIFDHVNTPELVSDDCRTLAEDDGGNLWIGTKQGVIRKAGNQFKRFTNQDATELDSVPGAPLCARRNGGVWVGGNGRLYWIHKNQAKTYEGKFSSPDRPGWVTAIQEDETGKIWLGTTAGFVRFDPNNESFELAPMKKQFERLPAVAIRKSSDDNFWVLFSTGTSDPFLRGGASWITSFRKGVWRRECFGPGFNINPSSGGFIVEDQLASLWLSSGAGGLYRVVREEMQFVPMPSKSQNDVALSACCDREGNLWVGTMGSGLQRWIRRKVQAFSVQDGLANNNVWTICEGRDGRVWVGTDVGVSCFENGRITNIPADPDPNRSQVRSIVEDRTGTIWVGTMRSVERIEGDKLVEVTLPGDWVVKKTRVLLSAHDSAIWMGGVQGLTRFRDGQLLRYSKAEGLGSDEVRALLEDRSGDIWIGTLGGGLSHLHAGKPTTLTTANGLSNNNVWSLYEDADGAIWIGTENGLDRLQDARIFSFSKTQGLPVNQVNSILEDNFGRLWISHDHGIYWVEKEELNHVAAGRARSVRAVSYDESDGLLSTETNGQKSNPAACKTRDGRLWFSTTKGVAVFDPSKILVDKTAPLTVVERIRANGKLVFDNSPGAGLGENESGLGVAPNGKRLSTQMVVNEKPVRDAQSVLWRLPPGSARVMEFHYTANTFVAPEKARFKYRLRGLDDHWIEASTRREAYFTDLRPGDYQFEVMACNHHGLWPDSGTIVGVQLLPFFYQTWWFYGGSGALVSALVAGILMWRVREVRRIHQLERANALNEQRKQIARDIHDDLGASLTHIIQMSGNRLGQPDKAADHADRIRATAEQAVDHISEILWVTNPSYDTLEDLVMYLREYAATFFESSSIAVQFDFPESVRSQKVSGPFRRHVLLLVKEALQNVMKHAAAKKVCLSLRQNDGRLELSIVDDGRGLPAKETEKRGNGLVNMRERVTELKGSFELVSLPTHGTEVRVSVPLNEGS